MAIGDVIAKLAVSLSLETAAFEKNSVKASKRAAQTGREFEAVGDRIAGLGRKMAIAFAAIGGTAVIGQLAGVAKRAIESTAEIGRLAQAAGVTSSAFQELNYAASQVGISADQMADGMKELTLKIGEAAGGSKSAVAAFEDYGVSIRDTNGLVREADDLLPDIADAFKSLKSPAEQAAFAAQLFGEDVGPRMVPLLAQGSAAIADYRKAARELGIVLDDVAIAKAAEAEKKMAALNLVLEAKIAGAIVDNADAIVELADALGRLVEYAGKAARAWRYFSELDWRPGAGSFAEQFERIQMRDLGPGVELTPSAAAAIAARRNAPFLQPSGGSLLRTPPKSSARPATATPWGPAVQPGLSRAVGASAFGGTDWSMFTPGQGEGFIRASQAATAMVAPLQNIVSLTDRINLQVGAQLVRNFQAAAQGAIDLAGAAQSVMDRLFPVDARRRQYIEELALLRATYGGTAENAAKLAEAEKRLRAEWIASLPAAEALRSGFAKYLDAANDAADKSEVQTVRISQTYADMAQNIIGSLNQLSDALGGGKFLRILSLVAGLGLKLGQAGVFGSGFQANLAKIPGNANGTSHWGGGLTWVGERGPELVDLPRGSRVTPNNDLRGMGAIAQIVPSPYFDVVVDGRIVRAAPGIASAGAQGGFAMVRRSGTRRVA